MGIEESTKSLVHCVGHASAIIGVSRTLRYSH